MLKLKHLIANFDLAKQALINWEHDPTTLEESFSYYRISANAIYPFINNGEYCFLRLAPASEKLENNIMGELEFIKYLLSSGYNALQPVSSLSNRFFEKLSTRWGEYYACVFKRVKGEQLTEIEMSSNIAFAYGKSLGELHKLSHKFIPRVKKWAHSDILDWIDTVLSEYNADEVIRTELSEVRNELSRLPQTPEEYGLVHYDFETDNVFYDNETKSCYAIDFEDSMYHWYAVDIEQVFNTLSDELPGDNLAAVKQAFINGYESVCGDMTCIISLLPLMRRFIDLYTYARLLRSTYEEFDMPDWMTGLRKKLFGMMDRIRSQMQLNQSK